MDLFDVLLKEHQALRGAFASLELHLGPASDCGWEDCVPLDRARFRASLDEVWKALREHETLENRFLPDLLRRENPRDPDAGQALVESHREVDELLRLFSAVAACIQEDHVHGARMTLLRLRTELLKHLDEEERALFPRLRGRFGSRLLRDLGRDASRASLV